MGFAFFRSSFSRSSVSRLALVAACALVAPAGTQAQQLLPDIYVTASRLGGGIAGTSTSVITKEDIARAPQDNLPDLIAREAGVQTWSLFDGVNGAGTVVDLRGFGAAASSNTLVLVNGRRLNDIDMSAVDFSAIPRDSIERIEITRGNSAAVLYGDNAVGGVINIITKSAVGARPSARIEGVFGSFRRAEGNGSLTTSSGPWSISAFGNAISSDGYRENNVLRQQNGVGELRYTGERGSVYLNLSADNQHLGLPGGRSVTTSSSEVESDPRGATTPFDYGDKQGRNVAFGVTRMLNDSTELVIDGSYRRKDQQTAAFLTFLENYYDTKLSTFSVTPRLTNQHDLFGMPSKIIAGLDFYDSRYLSDRSMFKGMALIHKYDLHQRTLAGYAQETVALRPDTDLSFGGRIQSLDFSARDRYDPTAPGAFGLEALPLDKTETNHAWHVGLEHRLNPNLAVFGRVARSFRAPNVDERIGMAPFGTPVTFDLRTQTSQDWEAGARLHYGRLDFQASYYDMRLENELHFDPVNFVNTNLDPTRRYGVESTASLRVTDTLRLTAAGAYTRSIFREGPFAGNDVPLVARWTGNAGVAWDIWQKWLTFDAVVRFVGERRMDNDQANRQPMIQSRTTVDLRLGGVVDHFFWSASVQNLFDVAYLDYAAASANATRIGFYNAYPQPGRTFLVSAGVTW